MDDFTTTVGLAIGFPYRNNIKDEWQVIKEVKVRAFTIKDRINTLKLAKVDPIEAAVDFVRRVIVEPSLTDKQAERIASVDREIIMAACHTITRGYFVNIDVVCDGRMCGSTNTVTVDFNKLNKDIKFDVDGVFKNVDGEMQCKIEIPDVSDVIMRCRTAVQDYETSKVLKQTKSEIQATTAMYASLLVKWGDKTKGFSSEFIESLGDIRKHIIDKDGHDVIVSQYDYLEQAIDQKYFGYPLRNTYRCGGCNQEKTYTFDMVTLFFLNPLLK